MVVIIHNDTALEELGWSTVDFFSDLNSRKRIQVGYALGRRWNSAQR